jgi:enterochelin esterase family protein
MKTIIAIITTFIVISHPLSAQKAAGKMSWQTMKSKVFAGTIRQYGVYVPKQYDGKTEAALMVFQDGHAYASETGDFKTPLMMDRLIASGEMPVTIAIFINPGVFADNLKETQGWNTPKNLKPNRAVEYDTLSGAYAKFLETEILPAVSQTYKLTSNPDQRAICGLSSGGICAFTVAWQRPDLFRKVMSHVGSFTNIRGGHVYPALIRQEPVRPLRVFLQDGKNDLDNQFGNWFLSNQQMDAALRFRKYDSKFVITEGGHGGKDGGAIFADSLRWLWRK